MNREMERFWFELTKVVLVAALVGVVTWLLVQPLIRILDDRIAAKKAATTQAEPGDTR